MQHGHPSKRHQKPKLQKTFSSDNFSGFHFWSHLKKHTGEKPNICSMAIQASAIQSQSCRKTFLFRFSSSPSSLGYSRIQHAGPSKQAPSKTFLLTTFLIFILTILILPRWAGWDFGLREALFDLSDNFYIFILISKLPIILILTHNLFDHHYIACHQVQVQVDRCQRR